MPTAFSYNFPVVLTANGLQPQSPQSLLDQLVANVTVSAPGYTILPSGLVDDISGTDVAAISLIDQAKVETVNSLTPYGANVFTLQQLGQIYIGQPQPGQTTNTSVLVVFTSVSYGLVIPQGILVGDGTNVFQTQTGGVINSLGNSAPILAVAVTPGSTFGVPLNTVIHILSSVPAGLGVNNPTAGTPGGAFETYYSYRTRVLQAGLVACVGTPRCIKTLIGKLQPAQANLIAVQPASGGLRVIVAVNADLNDIAYAIFSSVADPATLQGSAVSSGRNVTVSLSDPPDTYNILLVSAPFQNVTMAITWNTVLTSFTGGSAFASLVQAPLAAYINGLGIGQVINVLEMERIFQQAVAASLDPALLTRLVFVVSINLTPTAPASGTFAISGDPESYFTCLPSNIVVAQG